MWTIGYIRNEFGLRNNRAGPENINVLTVGGSTTDQALVPFNSAYQFVLKELLSKTLKKNICVSNAGVDGYTSYGHIFSFENGLGLIPNLTPNFILLYLRVNEAVDTRVMHILPEVSRQERINFESFKQFLKKHSFLEQRIFPAYCYFSEQNYRNRSDLIVHKTNHPKQSAFSISKLNNNVALLSQANSENFFNRFSIIIIY